MNIRELESKIVEASNKYYGSGQSDITDIQFDNLLAELRNLDPDNKLLSTPGHGYVPTKNKVKHRCSLVGSLSKKREYSFSDTDLILPKYDGLTVILNYESGFFHSAVTRGDGVVGLDVSHKFKHQVPTEIPFIGNLSIRCEAIIKEEVFRNKYSKDYSNSRNLASGIVLSLEMDGREKDIDLVAHGIMDLHETIQEDLFMLYELGFEVPLKVNLGTLEEMKSQALSHGYQIDGLVVYPKDDKVFAYKFASDTAEVVIESIEWQMGTTGKFTPVANFSPVELMDTQVKRCSLHNYRRVKDLGIGVGSTIVITKSGDIIPHLVEVLDSTNNGDQTPPECPHCFSHLSISSTDIICENTYECKPQVLTKIHKLIGIAGLAEGFGNDALADFANTTKTSNTKTIIMECMLNPEVPEEFYSLTPSKRSMCIALWDRLVLKFKTGITNREFWLASGLPGLSNSTAEKLKDTDPNDLFTDDGCNESAIDRCPAPSNIKSEMKKEEHLIHLSFLRRVPRAEYVEAPKATPSISVVITGKLSMPRGKLAKILEEKGVQVKGSVTKDLDYLICDAPSTSSKYTSAVKLNVPIITEETLMRIVS